MALRAFLDPRVAPANATPTHLGKPGRWVILLEDETTLHRLLADAVTQHTNVPYLVGMGRRLRSHLSASSLADVTVASVHIAPSVAGRVGALQPSSRASSAWAAQTPSVRALSFL
jgi:hypothetical protein